MKILKTDMYLLLINEEAKINIQDAVINLHNNELHFALEECLYKDNDCKKVIAYYPLNSEAEELDLPLLPLTPRHEWGVHETHCCSKHGCKYGDNDCCVELGIVKQKYPCEACSDEEQEFSLKDMKKAIEMAREMDCSNYEYYGYCKKTYTEEEIIQSLSTQQLPKEFIPETYCNYGDECPSKGAYDKQHLCDVRLKTIKNSEGKEEIVGKYQY